MEKKTINKRIKEKGFSALFRLVFSRTMITILLLVLQIYLLYSIFNLVTHSSLLLAFF